MNYIFVVTSKTDIRGCVTIKLFVVPDSNINTLITKHSRYHAHISLAVVVWKQHLWLYNLRSVYKLLWCHRIRLIAWQESDVNVFNICHFGDVFSVSSNINPQAVES